MVAMYLTTEQVAKRLGVRPSTIRTWGRTGRLNGIHTSPSKHSPVRYPLAEIERFEREALRTCA